LQVVAVVEQIEVLALVDLLELVAAALELHGQQLHLLELQTLVAAVEAQVSVELEQAHLKVAMVDQESWFLDMPTP
jgi:hypothetical protein